MLLVLLLVVVGFLGIQTWRVVSAIVSIETAAVVPLPPSELSESHNQRTAAERQSPEDAPETVVKPEESVSDPDTTIDAPPSNTRLVSQAEAPAQAESQEARSASEVETPSRLEVVQQVVEAGIATGDPGESSIWEGREHLNILVLGVDRRAEGDQNADVIIVAHLDLLNHDLIGVSLPRDLLVDIPGVGPDKINSSFNHGVLANPDDPIAGVAKVRDTIESLFAIPIDGYVMVDFDGFEQIIDAVDGIAVTVPYDIVDTQYPTEDYGVETVSFDAGTQSMDGETALKYVRTRYADSDDARRERQIQVIEAIFDQGKSFSSIRNADEVILAMGSAIQTSFPLEEQLTLARLAFLMEPSNISLVALAPPLIEAGWTEDGRWIYTGDLTEINAFVRSTLGLAQ
jgi:LCP family protein required for cell wall assembly